MSKPKEEIYFKQLDGIRFLAVALVLIDHWSAGTITNRLPLGPLGVTMFFVLSGFLITRILIQSKITDDNTGRSHWFSIKQFMIRRSLRIFPIYFLSIFLCYVLDVSPVREKILWCITYSTNIYIALNGKWLGTIDHLWSLAVEEQYYLVFPYLILFLPQRFYKKIFSIMVVGAILLRMFFFFSGSDWVVSYASTATCLDCFGIGGLIAYWFTFQNNTLSKLNNSKYLYLSFVFLCILVFSRILLLNGKHDFINVVLERIFMAVFAGLLIIKTINGFGGFMKTFLENKTVIYLGRISYGIYLYHNFVYNHYHSTPSHPVVILLDKIQLSYPTIGNNFCFRIVLLSSITIVLASLSWYIIEKPINNLKKYFTY